MQPDEPESPQIENGGNLPASNQSHMDSGMIIQLSGAAIIVALWIISLVYTIYRSVANITLCPK